MDFRFSKLSYKEDEDPDTLEDNGDTVSYTSLNNIPLRLSAFNKTTITLVWHDDPSFFGGSEALINDLDLEIQQIDSKKLYRGNIFDNTGKSVEINAGNNALRDGINNVEKIILENPEDGFYNLTVKAILIRNGIFDDELRESNKRRPSHNKPRN